MSSRYMYYNEKILLKKLKKNENLIQVLMSLALQLMGDSIWNLFFHNYFFENFQRGVSHLH